MSAPTRRQFLSTLAIAPAVMLGTGREAQPPTRLRGLLTSGFSSANTWFTLADDRGLFRDAGLAPG